MNAGTEAWETPPLGSVDLHPTSAPNGARQFQARLIEIGPRVTSVGADWAVLTFAWAPGRYLRALAFPTVWRQLPTIVEGESYRVLGEVAFRDEVPIIRVLAMEGASPFTESMLDARSRRLKVRDSTQSGTTKGASVSASRDRQLDLPKCLIDDDNDRAIAILRKYYGTLAAGGGFTGSAFDTFDPSGTRAASANTFTSDDLVSVTLLSVTVPPRATLELLVRKRRQFEVLLEAVGPDREFAEEPSVSKEDFAPAWELWRALEALPGVGATITSKLMARKRPRLIPIFDSIIDAHALGDTGIHWRPLHSTLRRDDGAIHKRLTRIRDGAGIDQSVSALRVFDVLTWMEGSGHS